MRNQMISPNTDVESALSGMVASVLQTRVVVIKYPVAILTWPTREQRERE
jgi:hypothetical protein